MERPRRAEYTPLDFSQWQAGNSLSLSPKFQRRGVWKPAARSFFVDSLLIRNASPSYFICAKSNPKREIASFGR